MVKAAAPRKWKPAQHVRAALTHLTRASVKLRVDGYLADCENESWRAVIKFFREPREAYKETVA